MTGAAKFPLETEAADAALGYTISSAAAGSADLSAPLPTGPVLHLLGSGGGGG